MEFLLANHPLDCPICDQGGECDLQVKICHRCFLELLNLFLKRIVMMMMMIHQVEGTGNEVFGIGLVKVTCFCHCVLTAGPVHAVWQ